MRSEGRGFIVVATSLLLGIAAPAQQLVIERRAAPPAIPLTEPELQTLSESWPSIGDGLFWAHFEVPWPQYHASYGEPVTGGLLGNGDAAATLERGLGIRFGKGASASFDARDGYLKIVQTKAALGTIWQFIRRLESTAYCRRVALRTEIYELPKLQVLQLLESAAEHADHRPEREAVLRVVRAGKARLVSTHTLVTIPEKPSRCLDSQQIPFPMKKLPRGAPRDSLLKPIPNIPKLHSPWRDHGIMLEAEVKLRSGWLIDLSIALEHHHTRDAQATAGGSTLFKKTTGSSSFKLGDGTYSILATWSGDESETSQDDLWQIAFVTANVQTSKKLGSQRWSW